MAAVSLTDAKSFLNLTTTANDAEVERMIARAEKTISNKVGPLTPIVVTELHDAPGRNVLVLRKPPVISVTSVVADGVTTSTGFDLDSEAGLLYGDFGYAWSGLRRTVRVTYKAGRAQLPDDLEEAVLELVRHFWESQRVTVPGRPGFATGENSDVGAGAHVARYLLPYRVQSLIEPYLRPSVA